MRSVFIFIFSGIFMVSCSQPSVSESSTTTTTTTTTTQIIAPAKPVSKLNDTATQAILTLLNSYYGVKDALVASNATKADSMAKAFMATATSIQATLSGNTQLAPYMDIIIMANRLLLASKDPSCEPQRLQFSKISDALYTILKDAALKNAPVYREFCPMAFDEKGGYWLSNESEIKNPYFGKKMLECGDVTDSLK